MKRRNYFITLLAFIWVSTRAQTPSLYPYVVPNIDWIKYYSQTDGTESAPSTIDGNSSVYTTGYSGLNTAANLIVLKYDSTGVLNFSYSYNNGSSDIGKAIKVDNSGNVYVAGVSTGTTGNTQKDYIIIKLNSSGVSQWIKRYDRGVSNDDEATNLCVDGSGNVYVTGKSKNSSGNYDIVTLKLNGSNGNTVWTHIYSGSGLDDIGVGIAMSTNGSYVYVTGNTINSSTGSNIVTYALNQGSNTYYWSPVTTNGTANGTDVSKGIKVYGTDVIVCGEVVNTGTGVDYKVIKYSGSSGTIAWQSSYDYNNYTNRGCALTTDSAGNIGIVGTVYNGTTYDYHTVFYTPSGFQYAVNIEPTSLTTLTVDPVICNDTIAHHWYVGGEKQSSSRDIFVYQIVPSGNTGWTKTIDGLSSNFDAATSIMVNGVGVVYVGAKSKNSVANYDYTTIKLNQTPVYWPPDFGGESVNTGHLFLANKGQLIKSNNTPASEVLYYTHHTNPSVFIEKNGFDFVFNHPDTSQNPVDTLERIQYKFLANNSNADFHELLPRGTRYNYYLSYATSSSVEGIRGNERVFIPNYYPYVDLHYFSGPKGLKYYFVVKPGAFLNEITMEINGANSTSINGTTGALEIDGTLGDIYFDRPKAYTVNNSGQVVTIPGNASWYHSSGNQYKITPPTYTASLPLIIQVGVTLPTLPSTNKITGTNLEYSTYKGGTSTDVFNDIHVRPNGNRTVVGYETGGVFPTQNSVQFYSGNWDAVFLFYTADDTLRVSSYMGGEGQDYATTVSHDSQGNIFMGGITTSTTMFGVNVTGATNQFTNLGASGSYKQDGFLAKFLVPTASTYSSSLLWRRYFGGSHSDAVNSIFIDGSDNLYVAGYSYSTNFPVVNAYKSTGCATTAVNPGNRDAIFGKFNSSLTAQWITYYGGSTNGVSNTETVDSGNDIVVDVNGYVIGAGFTDSNNLPTTNATGQTNTFYKSTISGQSDGFIVRYNSSGTPDFSSYFGGNNSDGINRLVYKIWPGEIYFAGTSYEASGFPFVSKSGAFNSQYSATGNTPFVGYMDGNLNKQWCTFWGKGMKGSQAKQYQVNGLSVDDDGLVYLSGWTNCDTLTYPPIYPVTVVYKDTLRSNEDGFVTIFKQDKSLYHTHYFGGTLNDRIHNSDVGQGQKLYVVGYSSSTDFPISFPYSSPTILIDSVLKGGQDGFISRFDLENYQVTSIIEQTFDDLKVLIYPNPSSTVFNIELKGDQKSKTIIKVHNMLGQKLYEGELSDNNTRIPCYSWSNGVYLITLNNNNKTSSFKVIKE